MPDLPNPDISVIIRAHDPTQMTTLARAIRSVNAQRGTAQIEIVLETSNFSDPLMLQDFVDTPTRRISLNHYNMHHVGDSRVDLMRHGVRAAQAPALTFLDFDDTLHPTGLARLHDGLSASETANIIIGNIDLVHKDANGKTKSVPYHSRRPTIIDVLRRNSVPIHSYMIRTAVARRAVARVPAITLFEDYAFLLAALEEGHVHFLQPFKSVGRYNIADNQLTKYRDVSDFSLKVITDFAASLQVPVSVEDLKNSGQEVSRQKAQNAMLDAMPEVNAPHVVGLVEAVPEPHTGRRRTTKQANLARPMIVSGWVCNTQAPDDILWGVYALTAKGDYLHISHRDDRPDVAAQLNVANGPYGYSDVVDTKDVIAVYVVTGARKKALPFIRS